MTLQALISTVDGRFFARKYTPPFDDYLIINQSAESEPMPDPAPAGHRGARVFDCRERGLSKSRNAALARASADICLISDDDVVFLDDAQDIILRVFADNPRADVITFQARVPSGDFFKSYSARQKWHTRRSVMRVSSFEIAFRKQSVLRAGLRFDENFGLGARFPVGEENIFLTDALQRGMKLLYVPVPIVMHPVYSSGSNLDDAELLVARGAMFYRMFAAGAYFIGLLFAVKKTPLSRFGLFRFYRLMLSGMRRYKAEFKSKSKSEAKSGKRDE